MRPPYSASITRYALHLRLRHSWLTGYYVKKFPMILFSSSNKTQKGGVGASKALKALHQKGSFSSNCILMIDELYLQKSAPIRRVCRSRQRRKIARRNCCVYGSLIKTVYTFRCSGHSRSHFNRQWLTKKIVDNIDNLIEIGLNVRGIITDNHSANVNAFSALTKTFSSESNIT